MKVSDHTMTILTGLVLTVTVGMLAQNSDTIMASFSGGNLLAINDDAYTVRAGKPQSLDIFLNDRIPGDTDIAALRIVDDPQCGSVSASDGQVQFLNSEDCSGPVDFTYCVSDERDCKTATVALNVIRRAPLAVTLASSDVAQSAPSSSSVATAGIKSAATTPEIALPVAMPEIEPQVAATEVQPATTNVYVATASAMSEMAELRVQDAAPASSVNNIAELGQSSPSGAFIETATLSAPSESDAFDIALVETDTRGVNADSLVAAAPVITVVAATASGAIIQPGVEPAPLTAALSEVEIAAPEIPAAAAQPCLVEMTAIPVSAGEILVALTAPCMPDAALTIRQGEFAFAAVTDQAGQFSVTIPAFASTAEVRIVLPDGVEKTANVVVPDADRYYRIAVVWNGLIDLDLHAAEYGARPDTPGYVWSGDPASYRQSRQTGGGYLQTFGSAGGFAEVYTLPDSKRQPDGTIDLALHVADGTDGCDQNIDLRVLRLTAGTPDTANVRFTLGTCGDSMNGYEVVNALGDLRVAAR